MFGTSPNLIAAIPRLSSLFIAKASTIHPYVPARNAVHRCTCLCVCPVRGSASNGVNCVYRGRKDPSLTTHCLTRYTFYLQHERYLRTVRAYPARVERAGIFAVGAYHTHRLRICDRSDLLPPDDSHQQPAQRICMETIQITGARSCKALTCFLRCLTSLGPTLSVGHVP